MTRIVVDPAELSEAGRVLGGVAVELAELASQLQSCASATMPPQVAADVESLMATLNSLLSQIGANYHGAAVDLVRRALVASLDSLAGATGTSTASLAASMGVDLDTLGVAAPAAVAATASTHSFGSIVGGGGSGWSGPDSSVLGGSIVGGGGGLDVQMPDGFLSGHSVVGGGIRDDFGLIRSAEMQQNKREQLLNALDRASASGSFAGLPAGPIGGPSPIDVMWAAADGGISHTLAPSRTDIQNAFAGGGTMTDSEIGRISPNTLTGAERRSAGLG